MIVGDMEIYSQQTTHEEMIKNCKVYVMWGADLLKCNRLAQALLYFNGKVIKR